MPRNCGVPGCDRVHPLLADITHSHAVDAFDSTPPQPYVALPVSRLKHFRLMHDEGERQ